MAAAVQFLAAAGQRLLLQAPAPSVDEAAAPSASTTASNDTGGYDVSLGTQASCVNSTSPICFSTAISGENLITGMWVNTVIGLACYLAFVLVRSLKGFEFYHARLLLPQVSRKPPQLELHGHRRLWGWLLPVFRVTDEELVRSAGLDALIAVRIISFGVILFLPMTVVGMAVLLPINYTSDYYKQYAEEEGMDEYTSVFMRMTISNIRQRSPLLWVHFVVVYLNVFWACWLIVEYYKEYIALRQTYLVRCTTVPGEPLGGSSSATPLLTPTMGPSRSPMKRGLAVSSPTRRAGPSAALSLLRGSAGRAVNRLKLPRRNASCAGDDFGEFAFRPSRFASPSSSPLAGSPSHAPPGKARDGAEAAPGGGIFQYGCPPRYSHMRQSSSPGAGAAAAAVLVSADGSATAQGLAAALAALPSGSPTRREGVPPATCALREGSEGIELADAAAFGSTDVAAAVAGGWGPEASGTSTPCEVDGRASRPLLPSSSLRSSDRTRPRASELPQRPPRPEEQRAQERWPAASEDATVCSLSFGQGSGLADLGSISLHGSEDEDTAASPALPASAAAPPASTSLAAAPAAPGVTPGSGSTQALLGGLAPDSAAPNAAGLGLERFQHGQASPPLPGALTRGAGSAAALLPLPAGDSAGGGSFDPAAPHRPRHNASSSFEVASALGLGQAPPRPEEICSAILSRGKAQRDGDGGDGEDSADGCGEGIAARWWTSYQLATETGLVPRVAHIGLSQSITMKGAVRLAAPGGAAAAAPGGGGSQLAVNASLFTCLVMDMPLEKLKLRRLGVFPTAWRMIQTEPSRPLSKAGGGGGAATPSAATAQEDIAAAIDELERGGGPEGARRASAEGLAGLASRVAHVWRNRGRLREWQRDVRWAMYNKRVRIATEMFSELFGADFDSIIPIYPTASVDRLAHKWDSKLAKLERLQAALADTPRHRPQRVAKLRQRVASLRGEVAALQGDIAAERDAVLSDLPSTCFFATFRSQQAAAVASQTNLNPIMQRLFKVLPAPRPDDVNWPALQRSWWQRTLRPLYALPIILFFMLLPIGMFTGAFAQLTIALCGNPNDPAARSASWYCSDDRWATFLRNALTSLAPSIVLSVYNMVFLPVMVYYAAQMEGQHVSLSALDRRCAHLFFYWDVFNVFLGALFGGTVLGEIQTFLEDPSYIWQALGSAIPAASNFFINYVMYRALVMCSFRLLYPHQAIVPAVAKWLRIMPRAKTPRDQLLEVPPRNCRYGRDIGIPVLMNYVMVCSMCITSPLILPFGLLYFVGLWGVWRYQALYVYQRQYESGGRFWPLVAHKVVGCQLIMVVFTACVLLFKGGYTQAALLFITLPVFLLRFDNYLTKRYDDLVRQVPLMAVHNAGRSAVPADIYTPPPLRAGGQGWHPEWGKVWQHWGIPRDVAF